MTCKSCGEPNKKCSCKNGATKAVVEINNPESLVLLRKVVIPASMGDERTVPPVMGKYRNVIMKYEASGGVYIYSSDGIPTSLETSIPQEVWDSLEEMQQEIDDLKNSPDVVDIVATYAALQSYDTSALTDNDIVRVLADETHDGQSTYYRWDADTSSWSYIGAVGDYYTKGQVDTLLGGKQNTLTAGSNITIVGDVISASDGTTVVQAPGVSTTSVMSQNAATNMVYKILEGDFPSVVSGAIQIDPTYAGAPSQVTDEDYGDVIMIGRGASVAGSGCCRSIQIGAESRSQFHGTAVGFKAMENGGGGVALGAFSDTSTSNVVSVGNSTYTYYTDTYGQTVTVPPFTRRIMNVGTPTDANDAATKDYVDNVTSYITPATQYSTSSSYAVGDYVIYEGDLYQCNTAITGGEAWTAAHWDAVPALQEQIDAAHSVVNLSVVIDNNSWGTPTLAYHFGGGEDIGVAQLSAAQGNQGLFQNDDSGEFVTEGELYEMIASGARVKLNHVPVGQSLTSPHTDPLIGTEYVDGIELTSKFITGVDGAPISVYSATVPFLLNVSASGNYPPLGVFLMRIDQEDPSDDTYEFYIQGRFDSANYT